MTPGATADWRPPTLAGLVTAAALLLALLAGASRIDVRGDPFVTDFPTDGAVNVLLVQGDGQAFAALARDPSLARPERFRPAEADIPVEAEAAYRAQRPALGYLTWALSLGQGPLVPWAMLLIAVAGGGLAVASVALVLIDRGYPRPIHAVGVLLLPSSITVLMWMNPELIALGLATLGLRAWPRRRGSSIALLAGAILFRETLLLVAVGLAAHTAVMRRDLRGALLLGCTAVPLGLWMLVLRARLGWFPWDAGERRLGLPLAGIIDATAQWSAADALFALAHIGLALVALRYWRDPLAWAALATVAFALLVGVEVWIDWRHIGRVLLPATVYALVLAVAPVPAGAAGLTPRAAAPPPPPARRPGAS